MGQNYSGVDSNIELDKAEEEEIGLSVFHQRVLPAHEIDHELICGYREPNTRIINLLCLYRFEGQRSFTSTDTWIATHTLPHLSTALSQAHFTELAQPRPNDWGRPAALCDTDGQFYYANPEFLRLLAVHFSDWSDTHLPFDLPRTHETVSFSINQLQVNVIPQTDLSLVQIWERDIADMLSRRELEVAHLASRYLTNKVIARRLERSPSTIANHLQRVYKKLDIKSRAELSALVNENR